MVSTLNGFGSGLLMLVTAVAIDTAWMALFRARPVGRFRVLREASALYTFESDFGRFEILPRERAIRGQTQGRPWRINAEEMRGLEFRCRESVAMVEELLRGLDLSDRMPRFVDTIDWYTLTLLTHDRRRIPLFVSGQYQPREFLLESYLQAQAWVLQRLGLATDVETQARGAMEDIRSRLGDLPLL